MAERRNNDLALEDYEPVTIDRWNGQTVKNTLDDKLKEFMKKHYDHVEDHSIVDLRLLICTVACAFSLSAVIYDYYNPFPASKYVLATCSIAYFICMGVLSLFTTYYEKNIFVVVLEKNPAGLGRDNKWILTSSLPRFSDKYKLGLKFVDGQNRKTRSSEIEKSISLWFDDKGCLQTKNLFLDFNQLYNEVKNKKDK